MSLPVPEFTFYYLLREGERVVDGESISSFLRSEEL